MMDIAKIAEKLQFINHDKYVKFICENSKTSCEECKRYDGNIYNEQGDIPKLPIHPHCQCRYKHVAIDDSSVVIASEKPLLIKTQEQLNAIVKKMVHIYKTAIPKPPRRTEHEANWLAMTFNWFFECGDNVVYFDSKSPQSQDIAKSFSMQKVKEEYFRTGRILERWPFSLAGSATGNFAEVEWFLGTYSIRNFKLQNGIATFTVYNKSG